MFVSHLSYPPSITASDTLKIKTNDPNELPSRDTTDHQGKWGGALFIAGEPSHFGDAYLSALSFIEAGGNYARLAVSDSITQFIANKGNHIVPVPQKETTSGNISIENVQALLNLSEKVDIVVLGPGLSQDDETLQVVLELAKGIQKPLILSRNGIMAIANDLGIIKSRLKETILTLDIEEMSLITKKAHMK